MNMNFYQIMQTHDVQGIIFDMDGTLLDSMPIWNNLSRNMLVSMGVEAKHDLDHTIRSMPSSKIPGYLCDAYQLSCTPQDIYLFTLRMVEEKYRYEVKLKPYVTEFLGDVKAMEIPCCVATVSKKTLAKAALFREDAIRYLKFVMTGEDVGNLGKDNPKIYLHSAFKLGVKPERCVVFEDTLQCVRTAKEAGFVVIGVEDPASEKDRDAIIDICDYYITSFKELL